MGYIPALYFPAVSDDSESMKHIALIVYVTGFGKTHHLRTKINI